MKIPCSTKEASWLIHRQSKGEVWVGRAAHGFHPRHDGGCSSISRVRYAFRIATWHGFGPRPREKAPVQSTNVTVSMFLYVNSNLSSFHPHYSPPQVPMLSCLFPLSRAACDMFFCFLLWPRDALRPSHRAASPLMGGMSPQAPIGANEGIAPCLWVTQGVEPAPLMKHEVVSRGGLKGLHQCWVPGSV